MLFLLISFIVSLALATLAYTQARGFVTRRLRYVDAIQNGFAPWIAGIVSAAVAMPLTMILPFVGAGTALSVGLAVELGVAAGAREVRHTLPRY